MSRKDDEGFDDRMARERVGQTIGGSWVVDRLLGIGGMAAVYAATHTSGRRAALKVLHRSLVDDPEMRARLLQEHEISQRIAHPARVQIWGVGATDDGAPMLMMDLLEGATLEQATQRSGRAPVSLVLAIADLLLDFLSAAHAADVLHRDLKPANVFITLDGDVRVLDFGVARTSTSRSTGRRLAIGTPSYMAPEQARASESDLDGRADLFSIGAMMYSMLSGCPLRSAQNDGELLRMAARDPARPAALAAPDLPPDVAQIIDRALAWSPRDRWADAAQMQAAVRRARLRTQELSPSRALLAALAFSATEEPEEEVERPTYTHAPPSVRTVAATTRPEPWSRVIV